MGRHSHSTLTLPFDGHAQAEITAEEMGFPKSDPLAGITAEETGPEIAAPLDLPIPPDVIRQAEDFIRRYAILPDVAYMPLATWAGATHLADVFDCFPYVALLSPVKRCGKTRVLEILGLLCANPIQATSISPAALFRLMANTPTLLVDEVEPLKTKSISETNQTILSILNAGHRKGGVVYRCEPPKFEPKPFPVYGPKAFAAIGSLPDTLADRSLCITMQRKTGAQTVGRFLQLRARAESETIRASLSAWAERNRADVQNAYMQAPDLPFLWDREAELWMSLFTTCAVAAPDRMVELKRCAQALTGTKAADDLEDSLPVKLLADVRSVWPGGAVHMLTASLLEALKGISDSPWADAGRELTARKLARILRSFGPEPRQIRVPTGTGKGYLRADFERAFSSYLPPMGAESETSETTRVNTGENAQIGRETEGLCFGSGNTVKPA
jgi:hypothetical protein